MQRKIEHPKVFISYAWGNDEYDKKVILFATDLKSDGVEVIFDKWSLKEGHDTYSYMEKSVTDTSITNVLVLLDPLYAKKADSRSGGVGTETQIISPEVYNKVEQEKFIPVIFERDENNYVCIPNYLRSLLYFDLTQDEKYDSEYQRLVKRLYGIDTIKEPELGNPPAWLQETPKISHKSQAIHEYFRGSSPDMLKKNKFKDYLSDIITKIFDYSIIDAEDLTKGYIELKSFRDEFLLLLKSSDYIKDGYIELISALELLATKVQRDSTSDVLLLKKTLVHELFIYIISHYFKRNDKEALKYILNKTYFIGTLDYNANDDSYNSFYIHNTKLDQAVCKRDNQNYYCGTATLWMELINVSVCNKSEFVLADLLCYNCSYLIENYKESWKWFPLTYIYSDESQHNSFRNYSLKLKSKEHLNIAMYIMGYNEIMKFTKKYLEIEEKLKKGDFKKCRYNSGFATAKDFWDFIKSTELGTRN
ncbi:hypothetical protein SDC9_98102 [bioreactor metagenome]|uniref:SEFIR domain-containing protein n=1 Tax=bioreactor metagenome TaxID=1076179 RepID=A0A645AP21_9ZZZZ